MVLVVVLTVSVKGLKSPVFEDSAPRELKAISKRAFDPLAPGVNWIPSWSVRRSTQAPALWVVLVNVAMVSAGQETPDELRPSSLY